MMDALIYHDWIDPWPFTRECAKRSLLRSQARFRNVRWTNADELKSTAWHSTTSLLVIPGGRDIPYCEQLNGVSNDSIREFVQHGGSVLGICAGAYYCCRKVEFEIHDPVLKIEGTRELLFLDAVARGSIHEIRNYDYRGNSGAAATTLEFAENVAHRLSVLYWGGPFFSDLGPSVEPLAVYADVPGTPPAVIRSRFGKGTVVGCGVHAEVSGEQLRHFVSLFEDDAAEKDRLGAVVARTYP